MKYLIMAIITLLSSGALAQESNYSERFNMQQNGKNMSVDDFSAWMESKGIRVAKGRAMRIKQKLFGGNDNAAAPTNTPTNGSTELTSEMQKKMLEREQYLRELETLQIKRWQKEGYINQIEVTQESSFVVDNNHTFEELNKGRSQDN